MAYNPFDFFRKNQKVLFAGLTVLVMFMFVLSFGQGDFFSRFPKWIEKFQTHGDPMAEIDGSTIKTSQLGAVSGDRGLANRYMLEANTRSLTSAAARAKKEAAAATTDTLRQQLDADARRVESYVNATRLPNEFWPMLRAEFSRLAADLGVLEGNTLKKDDKDRVKAVREYAEAAVAEMNRRTSGDRGENWVYFANQPNRGPRDQLEFMLWKKKADKLGVRYTEEDVAKLVADEFPAVTADELKALANDIAGKNNKQPSELYDALADEFRVRAAQTAVMGVNAVRNPAAPAVGTTRERYEHFVSETTATKYTMLAIPVEAYLAQVTGEPTTAELTDIFNKASNIDPNPASATPGVREPRKVGVRWAEVSGEEEYYKALAVQRGSAFRVVQASPAGKALFGGTVPPARAAAQYDDYAAAQARVGAYRQTKDANPGRPEVGNALLTAVGGGLMADPQSVYTFPKALPTQPILANRQDGLTDAEFARPGLVAALAGLSASALSTNAPLLAPVAAVTETAYRHTREQRVLAGIRAFQFPTLGGLNGLSEAVGGAVAMQASTTPTLPAAAVQAVLNTQTDEALRTEVATAEVQEFQKELARIMNQKLDAPKLADKTAQERAEREHKAKLTAQAAKYADEWVAARKLKAGGTSEPRAVQALGEDPGMAPLLAKDILMSGFDGKPKSTRAAVGFGQAFVNETEVRVTAEFRNEGRLKPATGLYQVRQYDPSLRREEKQDFAPPSPEVKYDNPMFAQFFAEMFALRVGGPRPLTMVWRTAEVDPVRPLSLASDKAARARCVEIWRLNKARELARQSANAAAQEIGKDSPGPALIGKRVTDAKEVLRKPFAASPAYTRFKEYGPEVPQFTVAKTLLGPEEGAGNPPRATPLLAFDPSHPDMPYAADKLKDELIAKKDSPVGTTFVVEDQPKTTLYLLVVAGRDTPGEDKFRSYLLYPAATSPTEDGRVLSPAGFAPLFAGYAADADRKTAVALLKAEFGYKNESSKLDDKKD